MCGIYGGGCKNTGEVKDTFVGGAFKKKPAG